MICSKDLIYLLKKSFLTYEHIFMRTGQKFKHITTYWFLETSGIDTKFGYGFIEGNITSKTLCSRIVTSFYRDTSKFQNITIYCFYKMFRSATIFEYIFEIRRIWKFWHKVALFLMHYLIWFKKKYARSLLN